MTIIAIIPIKHHSARIPGKNFKLMNGEPLYCWIIDTLLQVEVIDQIIIDSDSCYLFNALDMRYKDKLNCKKILLHKRSINLCGDDIATNDIFKDIINSMNLNADYYFQTHVTNPLLTVDTIIDFIKTFMNNKDVYTSAFSVKKHYARFYTKDGYDFNHNRTVLIPTQNLDPIYEENSCMYIFSKNSLFSCGARISDKALLYTMNNIESQDIDWPDDFLLTEMLMKHYLNCV